MSDPSKLRIKEFYRDSVILITGATGFMGQVLLEKILHSLKPRRIYVLLRQKRGKTVHQRMEEMVQSELFHRVNRNELLSRIVPMEVDYNKDQLALDASQRQQLAAEVEVVFHMMATVNFLESLDNALRTNVEYTRQVYLLARNFRRLKVLMHASTFYSNADQPLVQEKIYKDISFGGYDNVKHILAQLNAEEKAQFTPIVLKSLPNTYTYSKKCAEAMVEQEFNQLPVGIFRPPIVTSSYREPIPAWTNNLNGPCGAVAALYKGVVRIFPVDVGKRVLLAPVDYCANALLGCAVDMTKRNPGQKISVYNFAEDLPDITWGKLGKKLIAGLPFWRRLIFAHLLVIFTKIAFLHQLGYALMRLQAAIVDFFSRSKNKDRTMKSMTERIISYAEATKYFCFKQWYLENENVRRMVEAMDPTDAVQFPCDLRQVDWDEHLQSITPGVVKYMHKAEAERNKRKPVQTTTIV